MALRTIVKDGDDILKKECRQVTAFDERLKTLVDDMIETLKNEHGYGLAASQVGVLRRVFISLDERDMPNLEEGEELPDDYEEKYIVFVNPEITKQGETEMKYEGCLSFPGRTAAIERPKTLTVKAFDVNGNPFELEASDMLARCVCHELNHLDGITILDLADHFYEDLHDEDEQAEDNE